MDSIITSPSLYYISCILIGILLRWSVGLGSYSGMNKPPLYGDYEAQRHWQEITLNTPVSEWYKNTSDNDLLYWGLDYPPLTAYHSYACGYVAQNVNPEWVALHTSRGTEGYHHKIFMRYTVLIADLLVFFPALYLLFKHDTNRNTKREKLLCTLLYPGLILIDYGHFQYNNVSLGLFFFAVYFLQMNRDLLGAVFFSLALNYKQMELYHSIPFFCYLLGKSLKLGFVKGPLKVALLGTVVLGTFAFCWWPFLHSTESILLVVNRLFPVNRGLYEDKVANIWCSISPLLKIKEFLSSPKTIQVCIASTLLASLPSALHLLISPSIRAFKFSCVNISLAFFLFSYQVHEKSILIPAVSACLLYNEAGFLVFWFLYASTFSMVPLLYKDGLMLQFAALKFIFLIVSYFVNKNSSKPSQEFVKLSKLFACNMLSSSKMQRIIQVKFWISVLIMEALTMVMLLYKPPAHLPDLWPVLISTFSCVFFLGSLVCFTSLQFVTKSPTSLEVKKRK